MPAGADHEADRGVRAPLPDSFDPVEIALDATRGDPAADSPARNLLVNQNRLVLMQIASERMGVILKALTGAAGLIAAAALGVMVWDAAHDHSLVIEAFSTPPDFAAQGVSGQVLATELLDKLSALDSQTQSLRRSASYASSWSADAKVEIPTTGISVGELQRFLRAWLGHQTRISGELVRTPKGLALTVRAGGVGGEQVVSATGDVDELLQKAAVKLYKQTQPYRYFIYASRDGQTEEAEAVLRKQTNADDRRERAWAWSGLAFLYRDIEPAQAEDFARRSLAEVPDFAPAWGNLGFAAQSAGHPEQTLAGERRAAPLFRGAKDLDPTLARFNAVNSQTTIDLLLGDYRAGLADTDRIDALNRAVGDPDTATTQAQRAQLMIGLHEPLAGERLMPAGMFSLAPVQGRFVWIRDRREREDWAGLLAVAQPFIAGAFPLSKAQALTWRRSYLPLAAVARARSGDIAGARALIAGALPDAYEVLIAQGEIAAAAGDAGAADAWFGRAVAQAPSIPDAYVAWSRALLARGDRAGAAARAATAAARAPRFADPLEAWGEALLAGGDAKGAESRFRAADAIAPRWGRNHLFWGEALARLGEPARARAHWLAAQAMDLSPADRDRLDRHIREGR